MQATGETLAEALLAGSKKLNYPLSECQLTLLLDYLSLLEKWNRTFNLSAIRDARQMVPLHLLDSLSVAPHIEGERFLDVGTGGGLPGIPLAICFPARHFTLLDSAGKKTRFLHQVVQSLGLKNVTVVNTRAESFTSDHGFDGIISRAFATLADMTGCTAHLLAPGGQFWAMKGQQPEAELREIEKDYIVSKVIDLTVPGVEASRCLIALRPAPQSRH